MDLGYARPGTVRDHVDMEIGPGEWNEQWHCQDKGFVSVRGSGREATKIIGATDVAPADIVRCPDLEFSDLTFEGPDLAVRWLGIGNSTWTDVNLISTGGGDPGIQGAWADDLCSPDRNGHALLLRGADARARGEVDPLSPLRLLGPVL